MWGNCADTAESTFEIFISSAPRRQWSNRDMNANEARTPSSPPPAPVTWTVTSDPHSWELMGGGGRAGQRLSSMVARLKVRAGRDPG